MDRANGKPSGWKSLRNWRLGIATVLVVVGAVAVISGLPEVCEDQLAQTGNQGVVSVCHSPSLTDPRLLAFIVVILLLVWPDLSELSVGIVKLTRRVEEQAKQTAKVGEEVRLLGLELRQTISQQVSQSQQVVVNTAVTGGAREVSTAPAPSKGVPIDVILRTVRTQAAYERIRIPEAWYILDRPAERSPRVAIVGAGPDPRLREVEGLGDHLEPTYSTAGAHPGPVGETGSASIGHVLAIARSAVVFPVSVLNANFGLASPGALQEGVAAALGWAPDILLIGISGGTSIQDVDDMLVRVLDKTFVVSPAGNNAQSYASWPAALHGVAGVAALDDQNERAPFSNFGRGVDLAAPGEDVNSLLGVTEIRTLQLGLLSGTTLSADIVAGVAALLLAGTILKPVEVLPVLRNSAHRASEDALPVVDAKAAAERALLVGGQG